MFKNKELQYLTNVINSAYIFCYFNNDVANSAMIDAKAEIHRAGLDIKENKYFMNSAFKAYDTYERKIKVENREVYEYLLSCSDEMQKEVKKDIDIFYMSLKGYLDKFNVPDSTLLARLQLANTLLERSVLAYNKYFDACKEKIGYDISPYLLYSRLDGTYHWWNKLTKSIDKTYCKDIDIDFNKDKDCMLAYKILTTKMCNYDIIKKAVTDGLKEDAYGDAH